MSVCVLRCCRPKVERTRRCHRLSHFTMRGTTTGHHGDEHAKDGDCEPRSPMATVVHPLTASCNCRIVYPVRSRARSSRRWSVRGVHPSYLRARRAAKRSAKRVARAVEKRRFLYATSPDHHSEPLGEVPWTQLEGQHTLTPARRRMPPELVAETKRS